MKNNLLWILLSAGTLTALGQTEGDDLYFSSRDRKTEIATRPKVTTYTSETAQNLSSAPSPAFDGQYTGRTLNPDFNPDAESENSEIEYFNPAYAPLGVNGNLYSTSAPVAYYPYSRFNSSPYGYGSSAFGFGSPWGYNNMGWGGYYDPFNSWNSFGWGGGSPWYGGGCISCWSVTTTYGWGNSWWSSSSFGFGSSYGFGFPSYGFGGWNRWNNWYNTPNSYYNGYDRQPRVTYGRRPSRSTNYDNDAREPVRRGNAMIGGTNTKSSAAGRSTSESSSSYYQRGWRQDPSINSRSTTPTNSSAWGNSSGWSNSSGGRGGSSNSNWRSGSSGSSRSFSTPSSSGFGGSRSSGSFGGSSGGSSGGGRRGRN